MFPNKIPSNFTINGEHHDVFNKSFDSATPMSISSRGR